MMRITVTGRMSDHNNGLLINSSPSKTASQQLWREKKLFQKTKEGIHMFLLVIIIVDIHSPQREYPFATYIFETTCKNSTY